MQGDDLQLGIQIYQKDKLDDMPQNQKMKELINHVKEGKVVVLQDALSSDEKGRLIEQAMKEANQEFSGIEFETFEEQQQGGLLSSFRSDPAKLMVIVNADQAEDIRQSKDGLEALVLGGTHGT